VVELIQKDECCHKKKAENLMLCGHTACLRRWCARWRARWPRSCWSARPRAWASRPRSCSRSGPCCAPGCCPLRRRGSRRRPRLRALQAAVALFRNISLLRCMHGVKRGARGLRGAARARRMCQMRICCCIDAACVAPMWRGHACSALLSSPSSMSWGGRCHCAAMPHLHLQLL